MAYSYVFFFYIIVLLILVFIKLILSYPNISLKKKNLLSVMIVLSSRNLRYQCQAVGNSYSLFPLGTQGNTSEQLLMASGSFIRFAEAVMGCAVYPIPHWSPNLLFYINAFGVTASPTD